MATMVMVMTATAMMITTAMAMIGGSGDNSGKEMAETATTATIMAATATMTTTAMATIWGCDYSNGGNKEGNDSNDGGDDNSDDDGTNFDDYGSDSGDAIRSLSEGGRKQLLHAKERWPTVVHLALWPYALRCAALQHNTLPVLDNGTSRLELFSGVRCSAKLRHMHVFGCPVFALNNALASGNMVPRWSPCACLGLNLGPSPSHARNINLVLLLTTGLFSHCTFDDFF